VHAHDLVCRAPDEIGAQTPKLATLHIHLENMRHFNGVRYALLVLK
jgi:hypothetical protein